MRYRAFAAAALSLTCLTLPVPAQEREVQTPLPSADPTQIVQDLARWIDDRVFGVAVLDVNSLDLGTVLQQFAHSLNRAEPHPRANREDLLEARDEVLQFKEVVEQWLADYKNAGGGEGWILLAPSQALVVPLREGANVAKLSELLDSLELESGTKVTERNGVLVTIKPLRGLPLLDAPREPQLKEALSAADEIQPVARFVLIPTDNHRLFLGTVLPAVQQTTGIEVPKDLNLKVSWACIAASAPPMPEVRAVIKTTTYTAAQQVAALANQLMAKAMEDSQYPTINEVVRELKWIANEDRAELKLNASQFKRLVNASAPALARGRMEAQQMEIAMKGRAIVQAIQVYSVDHNDALPASLEELEKFIDDPKLLKHPRGRTWKILRPAKRITEIPEPARAVLLHEEFKTWPRHGVIVGFADGHIEVITTQERFRELIENR
jgi:hypothetical protein